MTSIEFGKRALSFIVGAGLGGLGVYFGLKGYLEEKYKKELENRWNSLMDTSESHKNTPRSDETEKDEVPSMEAQKVAYLGRKEELDILKKRTDDYKKLAVDYTSYADEDDENDIDLDQYASEQEHPVENRYRPPYEIESGEAGYGTDLNTVTYYTVDGILADDLTDESIDIPVSIGEDGVRIRMESTNDAVYIRNEQLGIDYEVLISNSSYADYMEEVNGFTDDD